MRLWAACAGESGAEVLEFAFAAPVLLSVIFGVMDFSRAIYSYHYCAQMAQDASRYAAVRGASWAGVSCSSPTTVQCAATANDVKNYVIANTPMGFSATSLTVNTTWPGTTATGASCSGSSITNNPGCLVTVTVAYSFSFALPFLPQNPLGLSSTSSITIMN